MHLEILCFMHGGKCTWRFYVLCREKQCSCRFYVLCKDHACTWRFFLFNAMIINAPFYARIMNLPGKCMSYARIMNASEMFFFMFYARE